MLGERVSGTRPRERRIRVGSRIECKRQPPCGRQRNRAGFAPVVAERALRRTALRARAHAEPNRRVGRRE